MKDPMPVNNDDDDMSNIPVDLNHLTTKPLTEPTSQPIRQLQMSNMNLVNKLALLHADIDSLQGSKVMEGFGLVGCWLVAKFFDL